MTKIYKSNTEICYVLDTCQNCNELLTLGSFHQYRIKENNCVIGIAVRCNNKVCLDVPSYYEEILPERI